MMSKMLIHQVNIVAQRTLRFMTADGEAVNTIASMPSASLMRSLSETVNRVTVSGPAHVSAAYNLYPPFGTKSKISNRGEKKNGLLQSDQGASSNPQMRCHHM